jgi:hypothetical protein
MGMCARKTRRKTGHLPVHNPVTDSQQLAGKCNAGVTQKEQLACQLHASSCGYHFACKLHASCMPAAADTTQKLQQSSGEAGGSGRSPHPLEQRPTAENSAESSPMISS